jgi:hypothetical protein
MILDLTYDVTGRLRGWWLAGLRPKEWISFADALTRRP